MAREHAAGLNARIRALNDHWKVLPSTSKLAGKNWTYGGAVSESEYEAAPVRVLWLLKDTNTALEEDSLPALLRYLAENESKLDTKTYQMWKVVAEATKELTGQEAASLGEALRMIAVVNVKKTPGKGGAVWPDLRRWGKLMPGLLREEIAILAPDVVVAGGTFSLIRDYVLSGMEGVCPDADDYCRRIRLRDLCPSLRRTEKNVCILDSYHPAARGGYTKTLMCDARGWGCGCRDTWAGC